MDNFRIDVTSEGDLEPTMKIAFGHANRRALGYRVEAKLSDQTRYRLMFFWSEHKDMIASPFPLDPQAAADWAKRWLAEQDYGREPDHDGDNGRGWRVYNEAWGHVGGLWQAFVAIEPVWAMYGK